MTPSIQVKNVSKNFNGMSAISDFSLTVMPGERRLILGPNGAGKTTLFNMIAGDLIADSGSILIFGQDVSNLSTAQRARLGLARTYQILTLFQNDSVVHNVVLALLVGEPFRWNPFSDLAARPDIRQQALIALAKVGLAHLADDQVSSCSYGEKRRLEIAIALAQQPRLLLLDEPFAGLSADERVRLAKMIESIPTDVAIVMIEHDMDSALAFAEIISVLHYGKLIEEGPRATVTASPKTREVYLGH